MIRLPSHFSSGGSLGALPPSGSVGAPPPRFYRVGAGDSIFSIAARYGVPAGRAKELIAANPGKSVTIRDTTGPDFTRLTVGETITLPAAWTRSGALSGPPNSVGATEPSYYPMIDGICNFGYDWDENSGLCVNNGGIFSSTPLKCPEGQEWNPITEDCVTPYSGKEYAQPGSKTCDDPNFVVTPDNLYCVHKDYTNPCMKNGAGGIINDQGECIPVNAGSTAPDCSSVPGAFPEKDANGNFTGDCAKCGANAHLAADGYCDCDAGFTYPGYGNDCIPVSGGGGGGGGSSTRISMSIRV